MTTQTGVPAASGPLAGAAGDYTVMAILPDAATAPAALAGLAGIAAILPAASLIALHVEVDVDHLAVDEEESAILRLREQREGSAAQKSADVQRAFDEWALVAPAAARVAWLKLAGGEEATVASALAGADLCIIARPANTEADDALHAAIFSHRLLLVMPPGAAGVPADPCQRIAVGWKPLKQVGSAMLLAMPFLQHARSVTLVPVDQPPESAEDGVLAAVRRMGVDPQLRLAQSAGRSVARTLIDEAHALGATALLAGAYRYGQVFEEIFGGVTRELVMTSDLPLFMAH